MYVRLLTSLLACSALIACDPGDDEGATVFGADGGGGGGGSKADGSDGGRTGDAGADDAGGGGGGSGEPDAAPEPVGLPVLGAGSHSIENVQVTVIGTAADGLRIPRDLEFNPYAEGELWVVNRADDSTSIFFDTGSPDQTSVHLIDPYALHFMEEVSSIAFGAEDRFATCQESRNTYNNQAMPNDFMGPALWSSDLDVYAHSNPQAVRAQGFDLGSHLDMLHESPLCMGIAWEVDNAYWIFEGMTGSIMRADFREDHGPGWDDHSDGVMWRYAIGEVSRVANIPSHLVYDHDSRLLYIADTGNHRVGVLDTNVGDTMRRLPIIEPGTTLMEVTDSAEVTTLYAEGLQAPSGLALHDGLLYVGDNATGRIHAITLQGELVDYLDTGLPNGALMGLELDEAGNIYLTDAVENRVLRIAPKN